MLKAKKCNEYLEFCFEMSTTEGARVNLHSPHLYVFCCMVVYLN